MSSSTSPTSPTKTAFDLVSKLANNVDATLGARDEMPGGFYLPNELWEIVAGNLDLETLLNFRLASKLYGALFRSHLHRNVKLMVCRESYDRFRAIAADPEFATNVRNLQIYDTTWHETDRWVKDEPLPSDNSELPLAMRRDRFHDQTYPPKDMTPEQGEQQWIAWLEHLREWHEMLRVAEDISLYQLITPSRFPKLASIEFLDIMGADWEGSPRYKLWNRILDRIGQRPSRGNTQNAVDWSNGRLISTALLALGGTKSRIRHLNIREFCPVTVVCYPQGVVRGMKQAIEHLETLNISWQTEFTIDKPWDWASRPGALLGYYESRDQWDTIFEQSAKNHDIAKWLGYAKNLREMHMQFEFDEFKPAAADEVEELSTFVGNQHWPRLEVVSFKNLRFIEDELLNFVMRHKATLKSLTLEDIKMLGGSWSSYFQSLREAVADGSLVLEHLSLYHEFISYDDVWHSTSLTPYGMEPADSLKRFSRNDSEDEKKPGPERSTPLGETVVKYVLGEISTYDWDDYDHNGELTTAAKIRGLSDDEKRNTIRRDAIKETARWDYSQDDCKKIANKLMRDCHWDDVVAMLDGSEDSSGIVRTFRWEAEKVAENLGIKKTKEK